MRLIVILASIPAGLLCAQTPEKPIVGTVVSFVAAQLQMEVKPDAGTEAVQIAFDTGTQVRRIAPGEKSLKNAATIAITEVALGDRVLVNLVPGSRQAQRIVVMASTDIARRRQQDQEDWNARGITGLVATSEGSVVTLRVRNLMTESTATVRTTPGTVWRRYAPGSVKFADAVPSSANEVKPGDQLRARGNKSADGTTVEAEEVVFGSFQTSAGTVTSVDAAAGVVTLKPLGGTGAPLLVRVRPDSQLKRMPDFAGGPPMGGAPPQGGPPMAMGGAPPDPSRMIERLPAASLDSLRVGETVVVSSTKGETANEVTAIMLLANAEFLIRMASMQQGGPGMGPGRPGAGGMGMGMGMGGGDLSSMMPALLQ